MRKQKTKEKRGPRQGAKAVLATLLCAACVAAALLAPGAVLRVRDKQILDTFYAEELRSGSLANPEIAQQVAVITTAAKWVERGSSPYYAPDEQELVDAYELLLENLYKLYQMGLVPGICVELLANYGMEFDMVEFMTETVSGYELTRYIASNHQYYNDYDYAGGYYLDAVLYEGQILQLSMNAEMNFWNDDVIGEIEEMGLTRGEYVQIMEGGTWMDMNDYMREYIRWLELDELEDWNVLDSDGSAYAISNYSMLTLNTTYYDYGYSGEVRLWLSY